MSEFFIAPTTLKRGLAEGVIVQEPDGRYRVVKGDYTGSFVQPYAEMPRMLAASLAKLNAAHERATKP